jgi:hypothetical protein
MSLYYLFVAVLLIKYCPVKNVFSINNNDTEVQQVNYKKTICVEQMIYADCCAWAMSGN